MPIRPGLRAKCQRNERNRFSSFHTSFESSQCTSTRTRETTLPPPPFRRFIMEFWMEPCWTKWRSEIQPIFLHYAGRKIGFGTKPIQFPPTISIMVAQRGAGEGEGERILRWNNLSFESLYGELVGGEGETERIDVKSSGDLRRNGGGGSANRLLPTRPRSRQHTGSTNPDETGEFSNFPFREIRAGLRTDRLRSALNLCQV